MFEFGKTKRIGTVFGVPISLFDLRARDTLAEMKNLAIEAQARPAVIRLADELTANCKDDTCRIRQIGSWVKEHVRFRNDPPVWVAKTGEMLESEVLYRPENMIEMIQRQGITTGDCDDSSTLLVSLFLAAGLKAGWIAVETGNYPGQLDHVYAWAYNRDIKQWQSYDVATSRQDWTGKRFIKTELKPMRSSNGVASGSFGDGFPWSSLFTSTGQTLSNIFGKQPEYYPAGGAYPSGYPAPVNVSAGFNLNSTTILAIGVLVVAMMFAMNRRY